MNSDENPEVIDLRSYTAAQAKAAKKKAPAPAGRAEPLLGSRPRAGLLLLAVILVMAALWLGPRLF